jgi:hypothetical protein
MSTSPSTSTPDSADPAPAGSNQGPADPGDPVVVRSCDDLVAAIPHLVGFPPEHSLVLVAMHRRGPRLRLGLVARFDLPAAGMGSRGPVPAAVRELVQQSVELLLRDAPEQVVALVFDAEPCSLHAPWRRLARQLTDAFRSADVALLDAVYVSGDHYRSYRCDDPRCCPPEGRPVARAGATVAELVAQGSAPLPSRAALHETVHPRDRHRAEAVELAARRHQLQIAPCWGDLGKSRWRSWQLETLRLLDDVAQRYLRGSGSITDDEAGRLLAGLCDLAVRDAAVVLLTAWGRGSHDDAGAPDGPAASAHVERFEALVDVVRRQRCPDVGSPPPGSDRDRLLDALWLDLASSCDGPLAVPALTVLGVHVWTQGNGSLASAAAERALRLDPDYRFARLLDEALQLGVRPPGARTCDEPVS